MVTIVLLKEACTCATPSTTVFFTFLRVRVPGFAMFAYLLLTNRFARTFTGACVGLCALTTDGKSMTVAQTTVTSEILQTLNVHLYFTTQIAFNDYFTHFGTKCLKLLVGQVFDLDVRLNTGCIAKLLGCCLANTKDVGQRDNSMFVIGYIDTGYTCHPNYSAFKALLCEFSATKMGREIIAPDSASSQAPSLRTSFATRLVPEGISPDAACGEAPSK